MHKRSLPGLDPLIRLIEGEDGAEGGNPPAGDGPPEGGEQDGAGAGKADDGGSGDGSTKGDKPGKDGDAGKAGDKAKPDADGKGKSDDETSWTPATRRYVEKLRTEAIKARKSSESESDKLREGLRALLDPEGAKGKETDPVELAKAAATERDEFRGQAASLTRELAVVRAASGLGVDGDRLLDSRAFESAVAALDPAAEGFAGKVRDLIRKAAEKDPALRVKPAPAPPQNGAGMGGEAGKGDAPSPSAVDKAREERRKRRSG